MELVREGNIFSHFQNKKIWFLSKKLSAFSTSVNVVITKEKTRIKMTNTEYTMTWQTMSTDTKLQLNHLNFLTRKEEPKSP